MAAPKKDEERVIDIIKVTRGECRFAVLGTSPLILNRMSEKAKRTLLLPGGRKTAAEKQSTAKHDPYAEFHASGYRSPDPKAPTLLRVGPSLSETKPQVFLKGTSRQPPA